jgi:hypothetical protein
MFHGWLRPAVRAAATTLALSHFAPSLVPAPAGAATATMPGDLDSLVTLNANFDTDNPNQPPNLSPPGAPAGDFLTLDTSAGTVLVVPSYDGLSRPVEIRQVNSPGQVMVVGHAIATPAAAERATLRWSAVAKDDAAVIQMMITARASNGAILASVEFLHQNALSYNGSLLPVTQVNRQAQRFAITANFLTRTTGLSIDGSPVQGFQAVPFVQSGEDIATVEIGGTGDHPQTMYADNISVVATYRVPDRAPTVSAPPTVAGSEGAPLAFSVSASDPDGQAITSLTASPTPAGASFTPNLSNTAGSFAWTPGYTQSGSYTVTFTATNDLVASATTAITIAEIDRAPAVTAPASVSGSENLLLSFTVSAADPDGDAIASLTPSVLPTGAVFAPDPGNASGTFAWTPGFSQSGSYHVTFTAANALSGSATTAISIANFDRPPVVTAPPVVDGEEGGVLLFDVGAVDPDGESLGAITADMSALPAGHGATFTPGAGNLSGTFRWPMAHGEAGAYVVVFSASNGAIGSASSLINVSFAGTTITGELIWTPKPGDEGTYAVTFTAVNNLGEPGEATTTLVIGSSSGVVTPPLRATASSDATLAPQRPTKGPIVRATGFQDGTVGKTVTVSATASDDGGALAGSPFRARTISGASTATSGIVTFDADLTGLPAGHDAIWVIDNEPIVSAPASRTTDPGTAIAFNVTASDPDGDPLFGLTADLSALPAGNTAAFTPNGAFTSGAFAWTPRAEDAGTFVVTFTAFNQLVGAAATSITVRPVAPAEIFLAGPKKFRLSSNRPFGCIQIEPIAESFALFDVDPASLRMVSVGTGIVSEISAGSSKELVIGDRDNDQIADMQVCFDRDALRALFSNLRGQQVVPVVVRGRLLTGSLFEGPLALEIVAGGGPLNTVLAPNPLNPAGTLSFLTKTPGRVRVSLFDLSGRFIRSLWENPAAPAGAHEVAVDGRGADRRPLSSGVYFYRIESVDGIASGRFTVLK